MVRQEYFNVTCSAKCFEELISDAHKQWPFLLKIFTTIGLCLAEMFSAFMKNAYPIFA